MNNVGWRFAWEGTKSRSTCKISRARITGLDLEVRQFDMQSLESPGSLRTRLIPWNSSFIELHLLQLQGLRHGQTQHPIRLIKHLRPSNPRQGPAEFRNDYFFSGSSAVGCERLGLWNNGSKLNFHAVAATLVGIWLVASAYVCQKISKVIQNFGMGGWFPCRTDYATALNIAINWHWSLGLAWPHSTWAKVSCHPKKRSFLYTVVTLRRSVAYVSQLLGIEHDCSNGLRSSDCSTYQEKAYSGIILNFCNVKWRYSVNVQGLWSLEQFHTYYRDICQCIKLTPRRN